MIARDALPPLDEPALIGVSGGRDSVALLDVLAGFGARLVVCHLDHALRDESAAEADFVKELAGRYGLPFTGAREEVARRAQETRQSIETAARAARYDFFARIANAHDSRRLYLAHHADDQVETVLLQLLRGAGANGLAGMRKVSVREIGDVQLEIVRPLLGVFGAEIGAYIAAHELRYMDDASNADLRFTRNRIRHDVLPALEKAFGRDVRLALWRSAELLAAEDEFLGAQSDLHRDAAELSTIEMRELPLALQRRVIHAWLKRMGVPDLGFAEVESVRSLLDAGPAKVNLPGGGHARRREKRIFFEGAKAASAGKPDTE